MIAALFVETNGAYFGLPDVDPWDKERDARKYRGPYSVVAHPPCHLWVNLAAVNQERYGRKAAWKGGGDDGCFASALHSVRAYGGVLEHPADSHAWAKYDLPHPLCGGWTSTLLRPDQWVCEVWQSAYGHRARKRTWLLYIGDQPPMPLRWNAKPGEAQVGWFDRNKPTLGKKEANATPPEFREALIALARGARTKSEAA